MKFGPGSTPWSSETAPADKFRMGAQAILRMAPRHAVFEHPEDRTRSSPAVLGDMFCPLLFGENDIENAILKSTSPVEQARALEES